MQFTPFWEVDPTMGAEKIILKSRGAVVRPRCIDFMLPIGKAVHRTVSCEEKLQDRLVNDPYFGALEPSSSGFMEEFGFVPANGKDIEELHLHSPLGMEHGRLLADDLFGQGNLVIHENEYLDFHSLLVEPMMTTEPERKLMVLRDVTNQVEKPIQPRRKRSKLHPSGKDNEIVIVQHHFDAQEKPYARAISASKNIDLEQGGVEPRTRRHPDDMYTPLWVRGSGSSREGYCELCHPGVWLKIKQSAYWYHMNFIHGISATTGRPYDPPHDLRESAVLGPAGRTVLQVEGRCDSCLTWVILGHHELGSALNEAEFINANWWRHQQKCISTTLRRVEAKRQRSRQN